jgi:UDP-N-acetylglucosamine--N-acetylmuramyl-(pentapeptide) pyrophosphoryl-undecaprenol N-acetylglucosamine transferase
VQKNVLILAGGGGHTGYAYALAQALHKKVRLSFLAPEGDSLSKNRLSKFGNVEFFIKPRHPKTSASIFVTLLAKAFINSAKLPVNEFDVVVSTGSNFCVPPALVAWIKGVSVVNLESSVRFVKASKTARVLQPFAALTALQWEEQKRFLKGVVVGPMLPKPEVKPWNGGYILVTGGTYGHRLLFDALAESNLHNVVLQTGRVSSEPYEKKHPEWKVIASTDRFHELLAGAELIVTHFGMTLLESAVYKKPVVLVPNPEWTRTAGVEDAHYLAKKLNAVLVSEIRTKILLDSINEARKRKVPVLSDGAQNLANEIIKLTEK